MKQLSSEHALILITAWLSVSKSVAFLGPNLVTVKRNDKNRCLVSSILRNAAIEEDTLQWDLFCSNHARGSWRGTWTSYDFMGDVVDETFASVNLQLDPETNTVKHTHDVVVGSTTSECKTCFDSADVRTLTVGSYTKGQLFKYRSASIGMVCGPSLLRSQIMNTELILPFGNGRVRVIYQHAPVWEEGVEGGPPQGLKLFRTMVSREVLNADPPTIESESSKKPKRGNPRFFRPVPPFLWHKKWAGTSWTWGPQTGDRGWQIKELEEPDAWHGRPMGDDNNVWSMRLSGGILLQCPRVIVSGMGGLCRLAWLSEDDAIDETKAVVDPAKLLRVEASVIALEPIIDEESDVIRFKPPSLSSLRCDVLGKIGELENTSILEKLRNMGEMENEKDVEINPGEEKSHPTSGARRNDGPPVDDIGLKAIRNSLNL